MQTQSQSQMNLKDALVPQKHQLPKVLPTQYAFNPMCRGIAAHTGDDLMETSNLSKHAEGRVIRKITIRTYALCQHVFRIASLFFF